MRIPASTSPPTTTITFTVVLVPASAGADVLYAPGLRDLETIRVVCAAVTKPVNVIMGLPGAMFSVSELEQAGVKRISVGSAMARLAYGSVAKAAAEMRDRGTFTFADGIIGFAALEALVTEPA